MKAEHWMILGDQTKGEDITIHGICAESPSTETWMGDSSYFKVKICQGTDQLLPGFATIAHVSLMRGRDLVWQSAPKKCGSARAAIDFLRAYNLFDEAGINKGDALVDDYKKRVDELEPEAMRLFDWKLVGHPLVRETRQRRAGGPEDRHQAAAQRQTHPPIVSVLRTFKTLRRFS
jgi:hypothetical protein